MSKDIFKMSKSYEKDIIEDIKKDINVFLKVKNPTELMQIAAVEKDENIIGHLNNPSEKVKTASVKAHPDSIRHINNPSRELQLEAVRKDGFSINYIDHPIEEVQYNAVINEPFSVFCIKKPTRYVQDSAIKFMDRYDKEYIKSTFESIFSNKDDVDVFAGHILSNMDNLSYKMENFILNSVGISADGKNIDEEIKLFALKCDSFNMMYIKNPTAEMKLEADKEKEFKPGISVAEAKFLEFKKISGMINELDSDREKQLKIIKHDPEMISFIKEPFEDVQIEAIKASNSRAIRGINNPSKEVQMIAVKINPKAINYMKVIPFDEVQIEAVRLERTLSKNSYKSNHNITESVLDKNLSNGKFGKKL